MNKQFELLKKSFPLLALIITLILIFFPFPNLGIEIFLIVDYVIAIFLLMLHLFAVKSSVYFYSYKLISYFCFFTCGISIAATRTFLTTSDFERQLYFIRIIGTWICRENSLYGFFSTVLMSGVVLFFCRLFVKSATEISARFCLDSINSVLFDINQKLLKNEITEAEAENQKQQVSRKVDYYSGLGSSADILERTIIALTLLFAVVTVGGVSVGIVEFYLPWKEALSQYILLASGYFVVFIIPLFIVCVSLRIKK